MLQAPPAPGDQDPALRRAAVTALADQYFEKSNWPKGELWFAALAKESTTPEDRLDALLRQGICIERQSKFADALPILDQVSKDGAGTSQAVQAQFERGQSLLELGKLDQAKDAFEQVASAKDTGSLSAPRPSPPGHHRLPAKAATTTPRQSSPPSPTPTPHQPPARARASELGTAYLAAQESTNRPRKALRRVP